MARTVKRDSFKDHGSRPERKGSTRKDRQQARLGCKVAAASPPSAR